MHEDRVRMTLEAKFIKPLIALGIPGVALGVFYLLGNKFNFRFSEVSPVLSALVVVVFIVSITGVTIFALHRWSPQKNEAPEAASHDDKFDIISSEDLTIEFNGTSETCIPFTKPEALQHSGHEFQMKIRNVTDNKVAKILIRAELNMHYSGVTIQDHEKEMELVLIKGNQIVAELASDNAIFLYPSQSIDLDVNLQFQDYYYPDLPEENLLSRLVVFGPNFTLNRDITCRQI
jgi:hypothetical protein